MRSGTDRLRRCPAPTGSNFSFTTKSTKDGLDSKDISLHSVFQFGDIEVEHESCMNARKLHAGEDLGFLDRVRSSGNAS